MYRVRKIDTRGIAWVGDEGMGGVLRDHNIGTV